MKKKNLLLRKQSFCWFLVNNHVIFNVLCKYCQSLIFLFLLITIFCTLWKKINLKNKTMNCFLFYFQQPIKSQPLIKCHINAKYHSSGQQSIPNLTDGITVNRHGQSIFGDYQVYIKLSLSTKWIIKYKYFHKIKPNFIKMTIWQKLLRNTVFMHVFSFGWLFPFLVPCQVTLNFHCSFIVLNGLITFPQLT